MSGVPSERTRGILVIRVDEASGKNKSDQNVWDPNFVEGFVKVEVRGGSRNIKVQSTPKRVLANTIRWEEELRLDVLESSKELRLMLCRERRTGTRVGTSVIAACGIFVSDILEAVPIDKYFELFRPGAGGEGGFIRISINYEDLTRKTTSANGGGAAATTPQEFRTQVSIDPVEQAPAASTLHTNGTPRPQPSAAAQAALGMNNARSLPSAPSTAREQAPHEHAVSPPSKKRGRFPVIKLSVLLAAIVAVAVKAANEKNNKKK